MIKNFRLSQKITWRRRAILVVFAIAQKTRNSHTRGCGLCGSFRSICGVCVDARKLREIRELLLMARQTERLAVRALDRVRLLATKLTVTHLATETLTMVLPTQRADELTVKRLVADVADLTEPTLVARHAEKSGVGAEHDGNFPYNNEYY